MSNNQNFRFLSLICAFVTIQLSLHTATAIPLLKSQPLVRHRRQVDQTDLRPEVTYPNRTAVIQQSQRVPEFGPWGPWTESSHCSRSCGSGISYQDRICLEVRADGEHSCIGASRRYFSCNVDDCPPNSKDFRAKQCARFNSMQYKGKYYSWIPYHSAQTPCELNCMPKGGNFYARLDRRVIDGTRCRDDGSLDVCVDGQCMEVGCDRVLGSTTKVDVCGVCGGDGSSCRVVKGIFDEDDFEIGYNDILLIPVGATSILIQEIQPTNNYFALRNAAGVFYLNGNWRIEFPREIKIAGTTFHYERRQRNRLEVLRARGPTIEPVFFVLLYQEKNLGISYEYLIPATIKGSQPDSYEWMIGDSEECSQSCGGGLQIRMVSCIRKGDGDIVDEELCDPLLKPAVNTYCNIKPCPPGWQIGEWSACSQSCGGGMQFRLVFCHQLKEGNTVLLPDEVCEEPKPFFMRACNVETPCPEWVPGEWSECDRMCGSGNRTRTVECSSDRETLNQSLCDADKKPVEFQSCTLGPCEDVKWRVSEWSRCQYTCSPNIQTRQVHCANKDNVLFSVDTCDADEMPEMTKSCPKPARCEAMWHASEWSMCDSKCGKGKRIRIVECSLDRKTIDPSSCDSDKKPVEYESCTLGPCEEVNWTVSEWSRCQNSCRPSIQSRQVHCANKDGVFFPEGACHAAEMPELTRPCPKPVRCEAMWHASEWSECESTCGNGNRTRTVECSSERETRDPSLCDADRKPVEYESCTLGPCEEVKWRVSEWSRCEDSCSPKIQSRQAHCASDEGVFFPDNACNATEMPELTKACPKPAHCEAMWHVSGWSECDRMCGNGNRTRIVECSSKRETLDPSLCDADKKPAEYESCTLGPCEDVKWRVPEWSWCEDSCSPRNQSRQVHCVNEEDAVVPNNYCNASQMPEVTKPCPKPARCDAMWHASEWSECDHTCGSGNRTRKVECSSQGVRLAPSLCDAEKKPVEYESCTLGPCEEVKWRVSEWSGCKDSCNRSIQSRQVHCANEEGVVFPNNSCDTSKMPEVTKSCPKPARCEAMWHVSEWSECDRTCGNGNRTRTVECSSERETLDLSFCDADRKPVEFQSCTLGPCEEVKWVVSEWSECDQTCGKGNRTRTVQCSSEREKLDPFFCDADRKPVEYESCTLGPCEELKWTVTEWSECEDSCCQSSQSRQVHCTNLSGMIFPDDVCDAAKMPEVTRPCPKPPQCQAMWHASEWLECDRTCGYGNRTRTVECSLDGETLHPYLCDAEKKPVEFQSCNLGKCEDVKWTVSDWSECEDSCSPRNQSRQVHCANEEGVVFPNNSCDASQMPEVTKPCPKPPQCEAMWHASEWSLCNRMCGTGNRTRTVECSSERETLDTSFCDADKKPVEYESCTLGPCEEVKWTVSEWSGCEDSCSPSIQSRQVHCINDEGVVFRDNFCNASKMPEVIKPCPKPVRCEAMWRASEWSECDRKCGNGNRTRLVECSTERETIDTSFCDADKKPVEMKTCTHGQCEDVKWILSDWSGCEDSCSPNIQSRQVHCANQNGVVFLDDSCDAAKMPEVTKPCQKPAQCKAMWHASEWSECDRPCGNGNRTRTVECSSKRETLDPSLCDTDKKPAEFQSCTLEPCEDVKWIVSEWSGCEDSCSPSLQSRQVHCANEKGAVFPDDSCDAAKLPEVTKDCKKPASCETMWHVSEWSECDRPCGNGNRTRDVECSSESETLDPFLCDADKKPVEFQNCNLGPCEELKWTVFEWSGCEDSCSPSFQSRQVHCASKNGVVFPDKSCNATKIPLLKKPCPKPVHCKAIWPVSEWSEEVECDEVLGSTTKVDVCGVCGGDGSTCRVVKGVFGEDDLEIDCHNTTFGCCPDNETAATGLDYDGCDIPIDCVNTTYGCCPDNITVAFGPDNEGCGNVTDCAPSEFGCCEDNVTLASGTEFEGCDVKEVATISKEPLTTTPPPPACLNTTYGCCPDEVTTALGNNLEGCCFGLRFGCCPDNNTAALGPTFLGCRCQTYPYGCCPDDITPAHGFNYEGCKCENFRYGCCQDKITPATGPNFEGCVCQLMQYGCCPDGRTPMINERGDGCGCDSTRYGCCPDDKTAAASADLSGCPCDTLPYGCCPDGYTPARSSDLRECPCTAQRYRCCLDGRTVALGPNYEGCPCDSTRFGCCLDGKTTAQGPNFYGCPCETMRYGCCADGYTPAQGPRYEGCPDIVQPKPKIPTEVCGLPKDSGPCRNFSIRWYFDGNYGSCSRFWYGGCDGNGNKFVTTEECENTCVKPDGPEACLLPKIIGSCIEKIPSWYYDAESESCESFTYGGCLGNNNRFVTKEACEQKCINFQPPVPVNVCELSKDEGPCDKPTIQWYYNKENSRCEQFYYGGCKGNANTFESRRECENSCVASVVHAQDICRLPQEIGNCTEFKERWFFDYDNGECHIFMYSGCNGNENNFASFVECEKSCSMDTMLEEPTELQFKTEYCFQNQDPGPCSLAEVNWYYDASDGVCKEFYYGGCKGNQNRFKTRKECETSCFQAQDACSLAVVKGPCRGSFTQWYYDKEQEDCFEFIFSGCQGNANRFNTKESCFQRCKKEELTTTAPLIPDDVCVLSQEPGPCLGYYRMWYYDTSDNICKSFVYGGCEGNGNRFERTDCEASCVKKTVQVQPPVAVTYPPPRTTNEDVCRLPVEPGPCDEAHPRWFYDAQTQNCLSFAFGGCGGNKNRFKTSEICLKFCTGITVNKSGVCPAITDRFSSSAGDCETRCRDDADCRGDHKCCNNGCAMTCVPPAPATSDLLPDEVLVPATKPETAHIIPGPNVTEGRIGEPAELPCNALGWPRPTVTWWRDTTMLPLSSRRYEQLSSYALLIRSVVFEDAGEYSCHAYNGIGSGAIFKVTLIINLQPEPLPPAGGEEPDFNSRDSEPVVPKPFEFEASPDTTCIDNPKFSNCEVIVRNSYCYNKFYGKFCCASCIKAGQLIAPPDE